MNGAGAAEMFPCAADLVCRNLSLCWQFGERARKPVLGHKVQGWSLNPSTRWQFRLTCWTLCRGRAVAACR